MGLTDPQGTWERRETQGQLGRAESRALWGPEDIQGPRETREMWAPWDSMGTLAEMELEVFLGHHHLKETKENQAYRRQGRRDPPATQGPRERKV